jgi:hypothetical protein
MRFILVEFAVATLKMPVMVISLRTIRSRLSSSFGHSVCLKLSFKLFQQRPMIPYLFYMI